MEYKSLIIIPALNPEEKLLDYVDALLDNKVKRILVINDGSKEAKECIFKEISEKKNCYILNHATNLGKGRALKNGMEYFLKMEDVDEFNGVVTADSDGQHAVEDVIKLSELMNQTKDKVLLGERDFSSRKGIPFKSRFGNSATSVVFQCLYGKKVRDTQTGLRGIPKDLIRGFVDLSGERFQYEMNVLIRCAVSNIEMVDVAVQTIYIGNNNETHFRPIQDSIAIYSLLFKYFFAYISSAMMSSLIDIGLFQVILLILNFADKTLAIFASTIMARLCSSFFNYNMNKNVVFKSNAKGTLWKYYALCVMQMLTSAMLVSAISNRVFGYEVVIKIVVDSCLFLISYQVQKNIIFKNSQAA